MLQGRRRLGIGDWAIGDWEEGLGIGDWAIGDWEERLGIGQLGIGARNRNTFHQHTNQERQEDV